MLDAAASSAARDTGAERAFLRAARTGYLKATGTVRKIARVDAHRRNVQVWDSLVFRHREEPRA